MAIILAIWPAVPFCGRSRFATMYRPLGENTVGYTKIWDPSTAMRLQKVAPCGRRFCCCFPWAAPYEKSRPYRAPFLLLLTVVLAHGYEKSRPAGTFN